MNLIYVVSPFAGDVEGNIEYAKKASQAVINSGCAFFAPHLIYPSILDDTVPEQRAKGMEMGMTVLERCDELWAFGERISEGMAAEMREAERIGIPVRRFELDEQMGEVRAIEMGKVTVRDFLQDHPNATVHFMTPGGYCSVTPESLRTIREGGELTAHAGVSGTERVMPAEELLEQVICQMQQDRTDQNTFHLLTDWQKQAEVPETDMLVQTFG